MTNQHGWTRGERRRRWWRRWKRGCGATDADMPEEAETLAAAAAASRNSAVLSLTFVPRRPNASSARPLPLLCCIKRRPLQSFYWLLVDSLSMLSLSISVVPSLPWPLTFVSSHCRHINVNVAITNQQLLPLMVLLASAQAVASQMTVTSGELLTTIDEQC
jgi:hypothetical protein